MKRKTRHEAIKFVTEAIMERLKWYDSDTPITASKLHEILEDVQKQEQEDYSKWLRDVGLA